MKHAIATKVAGMHGALIDARFVAASAARFPVTTGRGPHLKYLPFFYGVLLVTAFDRDGAGRAITHLSLS